MRMPQLDETERALRRLELLVTRRLDGLRHGPHLGARAGIGTHMGESRPYQFGDDVRLMDWNATARTREPHVRTHIHEHDADLWLVLDVSARWHFGTAIHRKSELALAACAALALLTVRTGGRVGAIIDTPRGERIVPPRAGRAHASGILRAIADSVPPDGGGAPPLERALTHAGGAARRRSMVGVVSDFLSKPGWDDALQKLCRQHDVIGVEILDPRELHLPDVGQIRLADPATGRVLDIHTGDPRLRQRYADAARAQREAIADTLRAGRAGHLRLRTDRDWLADIAAFVEARQRVDRSGRRVPGRIV